MSWDIKKYITIQYKYQTLIAFHYMTEHPILIIGAAVYIQVDT